MYTLSVDFLIEGGLPFVADQAGDGEGGEGPDGLRFD